jgi:hypothetical protein
MFICMVEKILGHVAMYGHSTSSCREPLKCCKFIIVNKELSYSNRQGVISERVDILK